MKTKIIEKGNKLIAKFMGYTYYPNNSINGRVYYQKKGIKGDLLLDHTQPFSVKYHSSWEWLMPVLLKMRNENFGFRIQNLNGNDFICITKKDAHGKMIEVARSDDEDIFITFSPDSLIEDLFCVIVKALKTNI